MRHLVYRAVAVAVFSLVSVVAVAGPVPSKGAAADEGKKVGKKEGKGGGGGKKRPVGSESTADPRNTVMELHNRIRADVGVEGLTWSPDLAAYAQQWATHLAETSCTPQHRPTSGTWKQLHGENIYMGTASATPVQDAVAKWESEKKFYKGEPLSESDLRSLHYSQIVWRATTQVGCAVAECGDMVIVVCNYSPEGNWMGERAY